jgi:hypothetical protein
LATFTSQKKAATNNVQDKVLIVSQPPVLFSMELSPDLYIKKNPGCQCEGEKSPKMGSKLFSCGGCRHIYVY